MKTLDELQKMNRDDRVTGIPGKKVIAVGMATCGIAAGARPVMTSFAKEIRTWRCQKCRTEDDRLHWNVQFGADSRSL